jgi:hypothetical protein
MPFWSKQPVFHWYNLSYWLSGPPGLISKELPLINKYVDFFNIKTLSLNNDNSNDENNDENSTATMCEFIKENYIAVGTNGVGTNGVGTNANEVGTDTIYAPTKAHILDYLLHSNHPSYLPCIKSQNYFANRMNLPVKISWQLSPRVRSMFG